ncbi:MAG: hypothetical protein WD059_02690 [Balneolaceae bacterium]
MKKQINVKKNAGVTELILENETLQLKVVPELGGKISSLINKKTNTQFLYSSNEKMYGLKLPSYGDNFEPPYAFGFDECFPNIASGTFAFNGSEKNLPDHGELWTQPWEYELKGNSIHLSVNGVELNYRFTKSIHLKKDTVEIRYQLENFESFPFEYIWSSHPLLNVQAGDKILLPEDIDEMLLVSGTSGEDESNPHQLPWPWLDDQEKKIDYSFVQSHNSGMAVKLFASQLKKGIAGIYRKKTNESLIFNFNISKIPFLGIWLCYGGWPKGTNSEYTIALEPATGRPDSLSTAAKKGESSKIEIGEIKNWELNISIVNGQKLV